MMNLLNYTKKELEIYFEEINEKKYKATQVFEWIYRHRIFNIDEFVNIKKELRMKLQNHFEIKFLKVNNIEEDEETAKILFELFDGECVEAVLMKHKYGNSICISSQVGCNLGCTFCNSGKLKKIRNLEVNEMILQILQIENHFNVKVNSIVIMGIGEPFDNFDNVLKFFEICNDSKGLEIGARHMTVSTCGIVPKIIEFSKFPLQINLAISLHASNDKIRNELMPVNKMYNINKLMNAIKYYLNKTGRRVTIEYVMLNMINDQKKDAIKLANLLKNLNVYVNLIPYNNTDGEFSCSSKNTIEEFGLILKENNIDVTIRRKFGNKISAACGQLRSKEVK